MINKAFVRKCEFKQANDTGKQANMVTQKLHNFVDSTVEKLRNSYDFDVHGDRVNNFMKPNAVFARNQRHAFQITDNDLIKFIHGDRVFFEDFVDMLEHYIDIDVFIRLDD